MNGRVLVIGVGGLACPALRVLARSGLREVTLVDDDVVDESNLQRQVLFDDEHLGMSKADVAARVLGESFPGLVARAVVTRFVPENALELIEGHELVVEGADNFATKFLAFDAARLAKRPIVQAGAVRWSGWALASAPEPGPGACFRCVFEDVPRGDADTCAIAGVVGPVVGAVGALEAALALRVLHGDTTAFGELFAYDAAKPRIHRSRLAARPGCASCSGSISDLSRDRYAPSCAA